MNSRCAFCISVEALTVDIINRFSSQLSEEKYSELVSVIGED